MGKAPWVGEVPWLGKAPWVAGGLVVEKEGAGAERQAKERRPRPKGGLVDGCRAT